MSLQSAKGICPRTALKISATTFAMLMLATTALAILNRAILPYNATLALVERTIIESTLTVCCLGLWALIVVGVPSLLIAGIWTAIRRHL